MSFRDLTDIIGPLELPIRGIVYTLPAVSAPDGARILAALQGQGDLPDTELDRVLLGPVKEQMVTDGVNASELNRVLWTALADVQSGRAVAEVLWENGVDPKAIAALPKPNRAARRSKPSAAASTTKRPASTNGTKTA